MTVVIQSGAYDKNKVFVMYENVFYSADTLSYTSGVGENAISGTTWDFWTGTGSSTLTATMSGDVEVDCFFIDAHDLFTVGSNVVFEARIASVWTEIEDITPTDNSAILVIAKPVTADAFRVTATGASIGVIMVGSRLVFPQGIDTNYGSIAHSRKLELIGGNSINGQFTGMQVTKKSASISPTFPLLDASFVDNDMEEFEAHYNEGKPFVFGVIAPQLPADFGYCQRPVNASELMPTYSNGGIYEEFTMELGVYINE